MTTPVETVLFDIDDTLCEYRRSGREVLAGAFETVGVEPFFDIDAYESRYGEFVDATDTVADLRAECFTAIADERGRDPALGRAVAEAYATERDHRDVRALPGALAAVEGLAEEYRVGVVTNGAPGMQAKKLASLGLTDAFETVVHAGYDAPSKPDPEPFHRALSTLDGDPASTVHIGNSLASDVAGARAAGIRAVWLDDGTDPTPIPEYTLSSMAELANPPWRSGL